MKTIWMSGAVVLMIGLACGGKAAAVKDFGEAFDAATRRVNEVGADMAAAKEAKDVAAALKKFQDAMAELKAKDDELTKKHGARFTNANLPPELKAKSDAFMDAVKKMKDGPMAEAMKQHANAPEVAEIIKKMDESQ